MLLGVPPSTEFLLIARVRIAVATLLYIQLCLCVVALGALSYCSAPKTCRCPHKYPAYGHGTVQVDRVPENCSGKVYPNGLIDPQQGKSIHLDILQPLPYYQHRTG